MHEESAEAKVEEGRSGTDESQSQRYLREALAAAEKFKYKFHLEQQVSLELARRYDECRQKHTDDRALINKMEKELEKLVKIGYHGRYPLSVTNIRTDASIELIEKISLVPYDYSTHRDSLPKSISGNDNVRVDESQPQRRLRKAVAVVDRFKFKYCQEKTISSELARECDNLKIKHNEDRVLIDSIERELKRLIRLGYKGVGPVTAHSSALSTPGQASSPQKRMMARSSDSSSATTDTDISADASVGDSGELLSLSSITTKRWNEIEDDSKISYECNKRIESEAKTGRFLDMEACIRNNEIEIHSEIQERMGKEKIEFLDLHEKMYETRDIGYEIESALLMKRREALTTNKGEGLESELFGVENIKKATEARNSKETERLKEIQHEIKIERETTMIAERLREIEMERLKEIQCEIERENLRETERLREIQHEIERENAINAVRLKEIESEIERGNVRVAKRLKEIHHEIERDNVKEMVESERLKEIEIEVERENAMKAEWLKEIEYKIEIENAIKFDRLKEIQYEIDRDNAMKAERLKEIERENVKETERLEEIENEKARERKRLEETEREAAREKERLREIEKETARETERLKVIERETARETERSKEIEGERERLKEIERETEKLKEIERENARETEKLRKIHMINQTDIMRSEDVLKEVQHRLEQMTMPQLTPVITDGTINIPKDTVATSTLLSSSVPRPPFEVTVNHSEVEDRITSADEKGRRKVRNIEVLEEEEFEAPRLLSSSKCSQSQHTIRPTAIAAATATPSVDIINRDGVPSSISRPPAISVQKEPPPIKLFEHFLVVGASHQDGSNLAAHLLREDTHSNRVDGVEDLKSSSRMNLMRRIGSLIASTPYAFSPSSRPPSDRMDRNSGHGQPLKTPSAPSIYSFTQDSSAQGMGSSSPPTPTNSTRAWRRHSASTVSPPSSPSSSNSSKGTLRPSSVSYSFQSKSKGIQRSNSRTLGTWEGETRPAFKSEATPANILYQFMDPNSPTAQRPPVEVADFCLPLGGLLSSLGPTQTTSPGIHDAAHRFSDGMPSYADSSYNHNRDLILKVHTDKAYHGYKRYSNDCFVFVLDDKTVKTTKNEPCVENDEHVASPGSRLYGICVQQARKLSVPVCTIANALSSSADMDDIQRALDVCSTDRDDVESPRSFAFESKVCFTIISRFPLFDFFFEIIQQVIHLDEEDRWKEAMTGRRRKNTESYVPIGLLNEVIGRLIKVRAPHYGASISFNVRLGRSMTVNGHRFSPSAHSKVSMDGGEMAPTVTSSEPGTDCEHHHMSAVWSLSVLLSPVALSVELLVRVLGLMLCEAKLVILGADLCLVSAIIMGLQTLIQPLEWVAPAISILPSKLTEFVECPVPLLAGLIVKPTGTKTFCPAPIQMSRSVANSPCAASSNQPSKSFHFSPVKVEIPDSMGQREASGSSTTLQAACLRASKLLKRCGETMNSRDGSEPGMLSAVLDTDEKELFLCGRCTPEMSRELVMPCAQLLVDRIKACLSESASGPQRHSSSEKTYHGKVEKMAQGEEEKRIISKVRSIIADHIRWVISLCIGGDVDRRVADAELKFTSINLQRACAARAAHASTFEEVMSVAMDECNGEPDLSDSESDNEGAESCTVGQSESITVLKRRQMKGVKGSSETLLITIPRNASTSSTNTTTSSKESRIYTDNGHHHRPAASTQGLTIKRSLNKIINKHNLSLAVPSSPFSSSSGSSKSKGRYTTGPVDSKRGSMSVLLMSQQVSLEGTAAAFLNRFTSTQMYAEYAESDPSHAVNLKSYITAASTPPPPRPSLIDPSTLHPKGSFSKKLGRCLSNGFTQTLNVRRGSVVYYSDTSDDEGQISGAEFNYDDDSDDDERNLKQL